MNQEKAPASGPSRAPPVEGGTPEDEAKRQNMAEKAKSPARRQQGDAGFPGR